MPDSPGKRTFIPAEENAYDRWKDRVEKRIGWGWDLYRSNPDSDLRFMIRLGSRWGDSERGWVAFEMALGSLRFAIHDLGGMRDGEE
jgi:hypothetical protein